MHKNATVLMIVMLGCSEIDMEVLDTSIKTTESDNCREVLRDDKDVNGLLAMMQEGVRGSNIFLQRWTEVYQPIYPVNQ